METLTDTASEPSPSRATRTCGKTTLFNALTGSCQKVGNYPGVTVERKIGRLEGTAKTGAPWRSWTCRAPTASPRARPTRRGRRRSRGPVAGEPAPDVVVCVVDATNLERNLYLVTQVLDSGCRRSSR